MRQGRCWPDSPEDEGSTTEEAENRVQDGSGGGGPWQTPVACSQACAQPDGGQIPERIKGDDDRLFRHSWPVIGKTFINASLKQTTNTTQQAKPHACSQDRVIVSRRNWQSACARDIQDCKVDAPGQEDEARHIAQGEGSWEGLPRPVVVDQVPLGGRQLQGLGRGRLHAPGPRNTRAPPVALAPAACAQQAASYSDAGGRMEGQPRAGGSVPLEAQRP
mmetsp:Transcript_69267/g.206232  ORF Transcript_69267/g.206232 Transcript_69267/m.206232 type:complete len:219 (-) Transcript_69267:101-757(-)